MWTIGRRQQQALDALIEQKLGIPVRVLMEYAGLAVARAAARLGRAACLDELLHRDSPVRLEDAANGLPREGRLPVHVVCGHGQNAGDALVAARLLHAEGWSVTCHVDGSDAGTPEYFLQLATVRALGIPCLAFSDLPAGPSLVIDGVFGTGFQASRPLPPATADCFRRIAAIRAAGGRVLAIDVPSGLDADTAVYAEGAVEADVTVTFLYPKIGLVCDPGRDLAGTILLDRLGLPAATIDALLQQTRPDTVLPEWIERSQVQAYAPKRPRRMHKGQGGRMLLVAGSPGFAGAALLAGEAALRSGAGLLNVLTDNSLVTPILARIPEAMVTGLSDQEADHAARQLDDLLARQPEAAAIGPGIGISAASADRVATLIEQAPRLVLDADALTLIAADRSRFAPLLQARRSDPARQPAVLTPHPGEFRRLVPEAGPMPRHLAAAMLARTLGCVVVLKGAATVIAEPEGRILVNGTGNTGLARGGSGDVLTGLLLGLLAQGLDALPAAACAVHLHGSAADLAAACATPRTMLPGDLVRFFPEAFRLAGWDGDSAMAHGSRPETGNEPARLEQDRILWRFPQP